MCLAAHKGRMALAMRYLNRLTPEGTSGGLKLTGPLLGIAVKGGGSSVRPTMAIRSSGPRARRSVRVSGFGFRGASPDFGVRRSVFGVRCSAFGEAAGLLPLPRQNVWGVFFLKGQPFDVAVDFWADPPTLWVGSAMKLASRATVAALGLGGYGAGLAEDPWIGSSTALYALKDGKLTLKQSFGKEVLSQVARVKPPDFGRQRLYAHPVTGKLYLGEDLRYGKAFKQLIEIDPGTGAIKPVELPFDAEDLCFDWDGLAYLRTDKLVVRYDSVNWREVAWDYGEEREHVTFIGHSGYRETAVASGLATPGMRPVCWNMGGMGISPKGQLAVSCANSYGDPPHHDRGLVGVIPGAAGVKPYTPTLYPGRAKWQEIHIWDPHGRLVREDAVPGLHILHGTEIDNEGNLYVMAAANRMLDGKPYFNEMAGTLMKFKPGRKKPKVLSTSAGWGIPLPESDRPKRPADLADSKIGAAWVDGAEWFYGGLGFGGFNTSRAGGGCDCWNSKFAMDYYARSFVPETDHYSVAVLDTNGNLILRVGRYGNVDDGKPLDPKGGPPTTRSLGGDEVGLFHAAFVGVHSDRRLFIADAGNARILSVKLDYHAAERVALKGIPERRP